MIAAPPTIDQDPRWQAVQRRDRTARFVFGVTSTGIYCRPGCPSRRPRPDRVRYFDTAEQARAGGFRACRRCSPDEIDEWTRLTRQACALLDSGEAEPLAIAEVARRLAVSVSHLGRVFRATLGITPREYAAARRVDRLKATLADGSDVTAALYDAGYGSSSRLYERSDRELGMTPGGYRRGGAGLRIQYATAFCPLGWIVVAATERGICAVRLGDSEAELVAGLRHEFHAATLAPAEARLRGWLEAVVANLTDSASPVELPLDVRGTAFQRRVWEALSAIPRGTTVTYGRLAEQLGVPGGARAVGSACATNPVAVIVPCHRVVRANGDLGGYRWGLARKRQILAAEGIGTPAPEPD